MFQGSLNLLNHKFNGNAQSSDLYITWPFSTWSPRKDHIYLIKPAANKPITQPNYWGSSKVTNFSSLSEIMSQSLCCYCLLTFLVQKCFSGISIVTVTNNLLPLTKYCWKKGLGTFSYIPREISTLTHIWSFIPEKNTALSPLVNGGIEAI